MVNYDSGDQRDEHLIVDYDSYQSTVRSPPARLRLVTRGVLTFHMSAVQG